MTDKEIKELLASAVEAYRLIPKDLPVGMVIEAMTECQVIPVDAEVADTDLIASLKLAAEHLTRLIHRGSPEGLAGVA